MGSARPTDRYRPANKSQGDQPEVPSVSDWTSVSPVDPTIEKPVGVPDSFAVWRSPCGLMQDWAT